MDRRFEKYAIPADSDNGIEEEIVVDPASNSPLNQILFGPPGTGKTYHTINKAIEIIDPSFYAEHWDNRDKLREYFNKMLIKDWDSSNGRVAFCTFHQSYTYEDFVEGIKPKFNDKEGGDVSYHIEDGVFKRMCQLAKDEQKKRAIREDRIVSLNEAEYKTATFYKLSLGDSTLADDQMIYDYCIKNSVIAIGFASDIDFTDASEAEVNEYCANDNLPKFDAQAINYFKNYLKVGNYVVISKGNKYVRALGRVTGEYKYNPPSEIRYNHFRSVEWIFTDEEIPANEIYDRNLFQMSIYKLDASGIKKDFFVSQSASKSEYSTESSPEKFVLIIDEINRGNVSSIFGELITLIEKDKRKGGDEELETTLPYSKAPFNVPDNLYILGTMNTADRSVEALDSALRRRFDFEEMPPKYDLEELEYDVFGVQVHEVLSKINQRIERLIGKDHTIGHSYFILPAAKENEEGESEELDISPEQFVVNTFYSNIIPLLQEYFFGDMAKLGLVLGKGFVTDVKPRESDSVFAEFDYPGIDDFDERKQYKIVDHRESNGTEEMEEEESNSSFKAALHILMNRKVD
jgi:5-methylcytosine-specific restriction endonuclease McrBC GTP-binding regulatory subunit McrB